MAIVYPLTMPANPGPNNVEWKAVAAVAGFTSPFTLQEQVQVHQGQRLGARLTYPKMDEITFGPWLAWYLKLNGKQGTFLFGDSVRKTPYGSGGGTPLVDGAGQTGQSLLTKGWPASTLGNLKAGIDWIQIGSAEGSVLSGVFSGVTSWFTKIQIVSRTSTQVAIRFSLACPGTGGTLDWKLGSLFGLKNINPGAAEVSITASAGVPRIYKVLNDVDSDSSGDAIIDIWPRLRESPEDSAALFLSDCKAVFKLADNMMSWNVDVAKRSGFEIDIVEAS